MKATSIGLSVVVEKVLMKNMETGSVQSLDAEKKAFFNDFSLQVFMQVLEELSLGNDVRVMNFGTFYTTKVSSARLVNPLNRESKPDTKPIRLRIRPSKSTVNVLNNKS